MQLRLVVLSCSCLSNIFVHAADGLAYSALLKNELLGAGIEKIQDPQTEDRRLQSSTPEKRSLFNVRISHPIFLMPCMCALCFSTIQLVSLLLFLVYVILMTLIVNMKTSAHVFFFFQYSLNTKSSSPDSCTNISPYSLSPVSNKR